MKGQGRCTKNGYSVLGERKFVEGSVNGQPFMLWRENDNDCLNAELRKIRNQIQKGKITLPEGRSPYFVGANGAIRAS